MEKKVKVNIIGAGISGLSAGCYLQMNGFETEIFEKHSIPGGLCTSWKKGEYTFDGCAHWILGSNKGSSFYKMWSELLDMKKLDFLDHEYRVEIETLVNSNKHGNKKFRLYTNIDKLRDYLLDLAPEDKKQILDLCHSMRVIQRFDMPPILDKLPFLQATWRGIKMTRYLHLLFLFLKWKNITTLSFAAKLKNPFLKEAFQLIYDNQDVNMLVITVPLAIADAKSAGYPLGGSLEFAKKIEARYLELGGKIHYKTPVQKILVENDQAVGLLVRNNVKHYSDMTISAADWHYTVFDALDGKYVDKHILDLEKLNQLQLYYSVIQLSFGIAKDLSAFPHISRVPLAEPFHSPDGNTYDRLDVHIYNYDPSFAPKGKTSVIVSFYTTNGDYWINERKNNRTNYRTVKNDFVEKIIELLDQRLGGIREQIEEIDMATPATYQRYTGNWKGSIQGWLPGKNLLAGSPVGFKLPGLKNFYYSSQWNQPGGGLPVAIKQGRDVTKLICRNYHKEFQVIPATKKD